MLNWLYNLLSKVTDGLLIIILIICLIIGVYLLIKSADLFVSSASQLAHKLKVPSIIIGLTIVSFGTSAPEASVSINAALIGSADLSIGNVVGSNIANTLLVLGLPALFTPIIINKKEVKKDIIIMLIASLLLLLSCLFFDVNGTKGISFFEGIILFTGIVLYVIYNVINAKKANANDIENSDTNYAIDSDDSEDYEIEMALKYSTTNSKSEEQENSKKPKKLIIVLLLLVVGLVGVLIGGNLVTYSACNIAIQIGVSEVLIGLTVVALCTSLPELVTTLVAARKNENDIAIGNVVGSNIFNILFILGFTSIITPLYFAPIVIIDIVIVLGLSIGVLLLYRFKGQIKRNLGIIMVLAYFAYIAFIVLRELYNL